MKKLYVYKKILDRCMDCNNLNHPIQGFAWPFYCKKMPHVIEISSDLVRTGFPDYCPLSDFQEEE